ncbi:MAG TPA: penicillin-binding transpeptidase domain-containing protein [Acidimicrobiia bacterium]|nr:penicillin-binding transpeptidase domain-containing protein [Acidimicrobiia bacterium]
MRARAAFAAVLALAASSCSFGAGVEPVPSTTSTAVPAGTTTSVPAGLTPEDRTAAAAAAADYLDAWASFDWALASHFVTGPPAGFTAAHEGWAEGVGASSAAFIVEDILPADDGAGALVTFTATIEVAGAGAWEYQGSLPVVRAGRGWLVNWSPAVLHPSLEEGDTLRVARTWQTRAAILAVDGRPIASEQPVKVIGVVPEQVEDLTALLAGLEAAGIDPEQAQDEIEGPAVQPNWFVPVGTLSVSAYAAVAAELEALPGVVVRDGTERVRLPPPFADHVVGSTGVMTVELLDAFGPPYSATDTVGRSGLELALERRLAGTPDQQVQRVNRYGRMVEVLAEFPGTEPEAVTTTLDIDVQETVEAVIAAAPEPLAVVVVDVATGGIRGVASRPLNGFNRALGGLYPPGSAFKVITAAALLAEGVTPAQEVDCPEEVVVGGRRFTNAGEEALGRIPFVDAFAFSCNTTFAPLAATLLDRGELAATAAGFGFGTAPRLPLTASTPVFPEPADDAEEAAAAIGQGRVLASPLHLATVVAAVAGGGWQQPSLVVGDPSPRVPFAPQIAADLAELMLAVVARGTGTAAGVEGEEVRGKTGTAEYETGSGLGTHAWFIGYWGGYAFAVLAEGGGGGGTVAAPLAADLVERLAALPADAGQ